MLEMFLSALEEELQIKVSRQRAPIARMSRIMKKLESLTRAAEHLRAPAEPEQTCPSCNGLGIARDIDSIFRACDACNGTGKSNRSGRG